MKIYQKITGSLMIFIFLILFYVVAHAQVKAAASAVDVGTDPSGSDVQVNPSTDGSTYNKTITKTANCSDLYNELSIANERINSYQLQLNLTTEQINNNLQEAAFVNKEIVSSNCPVSK